MVLFEQSYLAQLVESFATTGEVRGIQPHGNGHINDTFLVDLEQGGTNVRYILQHINESVFIRPELVMENVRRVTEHLHRKPGNGTPSDSRLPHTHAPASSRRCLTLVPSRRGDCFVRDDAGRVWRLYVFIEGATSHDTLSSPDIAFEAARAFGRFQEQIADLSGPRLHETIPDFHHTPKRLDAFRQAVRDNRAGRVADAADEIAFVEENAHLAHQLQTPFERGHIPERITHNDTKINNVMIDDASGEGLCVIDLDTVMPGLALHDFGDLIRAAASTTDEDDPNLDLVDLNPTIFEALSTGYLSSAADFLTPAERALLPAAPRVLALELGMRFLGDHLNGDTYFKIHHPGHNLDRARNQLQLLRQMIARAEYMEETLQSAVHS